MGELNLNTDYDRFFRAKVNVNIGPIFQKATYLLNILTLRRYFQTDKLEENGTCSRPVSRKHFKLADNNEQQNMGQTLKMFIKKSKKLKIKDKSTFISLGYEIFFRRMLQCCEASTMKKTLHLGEQ